MFKLALEITFRYIKDKKIERVKMHFATEEIEEGLALGSFFDCVPYKRVVAEYVGDNVRGVKIENISIYPFKKKGGDKVD